MSAYAIDRSWGEPLCGPLDQEPSGIGRVEAIAMLQQATGELPLGDYDRRVLTWVSSWSTGTVAALASLLTRTGTTAPGRVVVGQVVHTSTTSTTARTAPAVKPAAPATTHEGARS